MGAKKLIFFLLISIIGLSLAGGLTVWAISDFNTALAAFMGYMGGAILVVGLILSTR